jgi:fibronectin type 3 domain-containing protein
MMGRVKALPKLSCAVGVLLVLLTALVLQGCSGISASTQSNGSGSGEKTGSPPAAPANLTATAGNQQVSLSWTASSGATSYNVKRSTTSGGPYTTISSPTTSTYLDSSVTNGTTYYYVVTAVNSSGQSGNSNQASAKPTAPAPAVPPAPANLTATAGNQRVSLSWTASSGATSYNVKRSTTSGGPYTTISSPTATTYVDSSVTNGTTYYYVVTAANSSGQSGNSNQASAKPTAPPPAVPPAPANLTATAGNQQVSLSWTASTGATSYNVKRSTTSGGPYTTISSPTATTYVDSSVTNGTTYYYVVTAVNASGQSGNSNQASATPTGSFSGTTVSINVLANRHAISPFIYGGSYPQDAAHVTDSGLSVVRWGGDATSTYNWQLQTNNSANDYYYEDYASEGFSNGSDASSTQFITDVENAGSHPLITMVMLPWVAQSPETSTTQGGTDNYHWSYSVATFGAQCSVDPYNTDAGNGLKTDCATPVTTNAVTSAYFPLLDDTTQTCSGSTCVYRNAWAAALATAFGSGTCAIPYSSVTSCHFYDMDNEIDIWGSTHRDVHPTPSGYDELANTYWTEATKLKTWDPQAVRFGPVSCCWWFYWNGANNNDKNAHGGVDFLPWWLNQIYWQDQISGTRSLDIFDLHAYPDANTGGLSTAQLQALAVSIYRDYWDPTFVSPSSSIDQIYTTNIQPNKTIPFRIPRMRAIVNSIYPGTPMSFTEWSAAFAGESDFSTALGDADAYGIFGRERLSLASRWTAPSPSNPNYLALKLYTNYDGAHHTFGTTSVSDSNNGNADTFSSYAALDSTGKTLTVMVLNKDPQNSAQAQFALAGFNATSYVAYTLTSSAPTAISASSSKSWTATQTFAPYSATLLVITGSLANTPSSDWDLNPDTIMVPASGTVALQPKISSGTANVTLSSATFDSYNGATACSGNISLTNPVITTSESGTITLSAGSTPGFCHFTVTGSDGTVTQTEGGWIVVGNPPAGLAATSGNGQTGAPGTTLTQSLSVTLSPGQSGGVAAGASILFTTNAGTLSNGTTSGSTVIAVTNSSGVASVTLTLPSSAQTLQVQAQAPYGLGNAVANFTETAQ